MLFLKRITVKLSWCKENKVFDTTSLKSIAEQMIHCMKGWGNEITNYYAA